MQKRAIFLSYGRKNRKAALALAADIRRLGNTVWIDEELRGGQHWWEQVLAEVKQCDAFVFAITAASVASEACRSELRWAGALHRPVLPVRLTDDVSSDQLPPGLVSLQMVDYRTRSHQSGLELARALDSLPLKNPLPNPLPKAIEQPPTSLRAHRHATPLVAIGILTVVAVVVAARGERPSEAQSPDPPTPVHGNAELALLPEQVPEPAPVSPAAPRKRGKHDAPSGPPPSDDRDLRQRVAAYALGKPLRLDQSEAERFARYWSENCRSTELATLDGELNRELSGAVDSARCIALRRAMWRVECLRDWLAKSSCRGSLGAPNR